MECWCTSRLYVGGGRLHTGGGIFHILSQLISLLSIPEVFKEKPKVIISTPPCSLPTFWRILMKARLCSFHKR
uniref:Uncharacterized protein n=2 Tax=Sus scrofa TaxID=9823 RepID=A0A8D0JSE1_PIG